ncbi:MAG: CcmD family protein [Salibacteraceae bacterium]
MIKYLLSIFSLLFFFSQGFAQEVAMADQMRADGKIYVVIAVLVLIFIGIVVYLFSLDKKINNIEKKLNK